MYPYASHNHIPINVNRITTYGTAIAHLPQLCYVFALQLLVFYNCAICSAIACLLQLCCLADVKRHDDTYNYVT